MSQTHAPPAGGTPRHLWVIGILGLLWTAMGALDYTMTQTRNAEWMGQFTQAELDYFYGFPAWVVACWAVAVWGGMLGCLLLLLRKRLAVRVLLLSLLGLAASTVHNYGFSDGLKIMGSPGALAFAAVIFVFSVFLYVYAKAMCRRGVLT